MSIFWAVMSAISSLSGNFVTRCPKCSGKMERKEMHEQSYMRAARIRNSFMARPTSTFNTELGRKVVIQVQVVPVYDICVNCGHRIRRKNVTLG